MMAWTVSFAEEFVAEVDALEKGLSWGVRMWIR